MAQNPFYIDPMNDFSEGLQGLTQSVQNYKQEEERQGKEEAKIAHVAAGKEAQRKAAEDGSPEAYAQLAIDYPELAEEFRASMGYRDAGREEEANDFQRDLQLADSPEEVSRLFKARIEEGRRQGLDMEQTAQSFMDWSTDPEKEMGDLRKFYAMTNPEGFNALKEYELNKPEKIETKVVDGVLVNAQTGDVIFEKAEIPPELDALDKGKLRKINAEIKKIEKETKQAKTKSLPEAQAKARGFYQRMTSSQGEIDRVFKEFPEFNPEASGERFMATLWGGNFLTSTEYQQYEQAKSDWVRAKLRRESGAVIAEEEMKAEFRTYFPVVGDGPEVIEQKKRARKVAERAMRESSGYTGEEVAEDVISDEDLLKKYGG